MSRTINKFSLFDFCKKQAGKMEKYGEETLDEEGNIIPFIEQAALITHYLQLDRKGVVLPYRDKAEDILNLWYEFIRGEKLSCKKLLGELTTMLTLAQEEFNGSLGVATQNKSTSSKTKQNNAATKKPATTKSAGKYVQY